MKHNERIIVEEGVRTLPKIRVIRSLNSWAGIKGLLASGT